MKRFDADFDNEINKTIKSFNQKIKRAEKRGEKGLPPLQSVREFKALYNTKQDAKRELRQYKALLNNKEALERYRTKEGTISNWEFGYIVQNLEATKEKVERELIKEKLRVRDYPDHLYAIKSNVLRLEAERNKLNRDINNLTAQELKTISAIENRVKRSDLKTIAGRKHFMRTLDALLTVQLVPQGERQRIQEKLDKLSNEQFNELYHRSDTIKSIMEHYIPEDENTVKILEDLDYDEDIKGVINDFTENLDEQIKDAKSAVKEFNELVEAGTGKVYSKKDFKNFIEKGKW